MIAKRSNKKPVKPRAKKVTAARRLPSASGSDAKSEASVEVDVSTLVGDIGAMIDAARKQVSFTANAALVTLYWQIGHRVQTEVLEGRRAEYGAEIVATASRELEVRHGRGFNEKSLRRMVQFATKFPDAQIVATLSRQLGWSHFVDLIPLKDSLKREFYAEMCRIERWSVRQLRERIDSMLFERTALSKKPEALIRKELSALRDKGDLSPALVFRDPYMLDFLGLADTYSEKDLESAILRDIERFLLELGSGFAFVERQKRLTLDGNDYYLDLLFFHRRMQRLIAIELKIGDFKPADSGQMDLYLRWLDRHERQPAEKPPLGIILCAGKKRETIEYLDLDKRGIHVAEYLTELPLREVLEERFHRAIEAARNRLALGAGAEPVLDERKSTGPVIKPRGRRK
jgi:predicted nuclease of restriction endonuclease-like (RecB) superfamily